MEPKIEKESLELKLYGVVINCNMSVTDNYENSKKLLAQSDDAGIVPTPEHLRGLIGTRSRVSLVEYKAPGETMDLTWDEYTRLGQPEEIQLKTFLYGKSPEQSNNKSMSPLALENTGFAKVYNYE